MKFWGRKHSGIVDVKNLAKVVIELIKKGYIFNETLMESMYGKKHLLG